LDDNGALSFFAAASYSIAVSVGIFVFWSYLMRLLPAVRTMASRIGLLASMGLGSLAIIAMSSWLNAAALAGSAAVEQHLAKTVQDYQGSLEQANLIAVSAQGLERDVARVRQSFEDLSEQEASGDLSGLAGRGAVFRVLSQKADELRGLEAQIASQQLLVDGAFTEGNAILSRMRALTVEPGPVEARSVLFSEEAVRLAGLPELDGRTGEAREGQRSTITSVLEVLGQRAATLRGAADTVVAMPPPADTTYTPISTADAVIRYAGNFAPSWAGAIAIDLLPAVLVFILMVTQAAIRSGREGVGIEQTLTLSELRAAMMVLHEMDEVRRPTGFSAVGPEDAAKAPAGPDPKP
jgi:hypothetical protein